MRVMHVVAGAGAPERPCPGGAESPVLPCAT